MKSLILTFAFALMAISTVSSISSAYSRCGGSCVGGNNAMYAAACQGASVNGEQACRNYSGLGCYWQPRMEIPGRCLGGNNEMLSHACAGASVNGEQACRNYSGLGCYWQPGTCR